MHLRRLAPWTIRLCRVPPERNGPLRMATGWPGAVASAKSGYSHVFLDRILLVSVIIVCPTMCQPSATELNSWVQLTDMQLLRQHDVHGPWHGCQSPAAALDVQGYSLQYRTPRAGTLFRTRIKVYCTTVATKRYSVRSRVTAVQGRRVGESSVRRIGCGSHGPVSEKVSDTASRRWVHAGRRSHTAAQRIPAAWAHIVHVRQSTCEQFGTRSNHRGSPQ